MRFFKKYNKYKKVRSEKLQLYISKDISFANIHGKAWSESSLNSVALNNTKETKCLL